MTASRRPDPQLPGPPPLSPPGATVAAGLDRDWQAEALAWQRIALQWQKLCAAAILDAACEGADRAISEFKALRDAQNGLERGRGDSGAS